MDTFALPEVGEALLEEARAHSSQRAARTLVGGSGHVLRQTVIALVDGAGLADHESPGEATLQVLSGQVRLSWSDGSAELDTGAHVVIPDERHGLLARTDAVVLLTTAMS